MQGNSTIWGPLLLSPPPSCLPHMPPPAGTGMGQLPKVDKSRVSQAQDDNHPVINAYTQSRVCAYGYCSRVHV